MDIAARQGWAIIGASTIAKEFMVQAIRSCGGDVRWIISGDQRRADAFAQDTSIPNSSTLLADAISDPSVDIVYVGSINSKHSEHVIAAAEAGKHILCDKPIATKPADAVQMIKACERAEVHFAINHHLRANRIHQKMRQLVEQGAIGDVRSMLILNAGKLRPKLQTWRIKDHAEGGINLDLSVHDIDLARFILRQDPLTATGISASVELGRNDIHDHTMYAVVMSKGSFLQVHESFVTAPISSRVTIVGSRGYLEATDTLSQKPSGKLVIGSRKSERQIDVENGEPYTETVRALIEAIAGRGQVLASGWDGLAALIGAEAIVAAFRTGRGVNVSSGYPI